jgi:uncharacterized protein YjbI with pentapeptide repeats
MPNSAQIQLLEQGVKKWNQWRSNHPGVSINLTKAELIKASLTGANLSGADLSGADLSGADLSEAKLNDAKLNEAKLSGADLSGADLSRANLNWADLHWGDLSWADLSKANLGLANLTEADLHKANLSRADLSGADLNKAKMSEANLSWSDLGLANLTEADLSKANLSEANLSGAVLIMAILSKANLNKANLNWADLSRADLRGASLRTARLVRATLDEANLTEAYMWETQRAEWSIKGIICESVYWDEKRKEKTPYGAGDFERLFAAVTRIRLLYKDGLNPLEIASLPGLVKLLNQSCPGGNLRLNTIHDDTGAVVELAIEDSAAPSAEEMRKLKTELEATARRAIESERTALEDHSVRLFLERRVEVLNQTVILLAATRGPYRLEEPTFESGRPSSPPPADDRGQSSGQLGNQAGNEAGRRFVPPIDLALLAKELSGLRQAIVAKRDSSIPATIALGRIAEAEIAAQERNIAKVMEHLGASGRWALEFARTVGKGLAMEAIKQSMPY